MKTQSTEVIRHGLLTKRRVRTIAILCWEFPIFVHQVVLRRMERMTGHQDQPFILNVATSLLIGYKARFVNTDHGRFRTWGQMYKDVK